MSNWDTAEAGGGAPIPREVALKLCTEIREKNKHNFVSLAGMQCWGCSRFTKGDPDKMCFNNKPGNRGCVLVNACFDASH